MTINKSDSGDTPEQADSLSATGMFFRAFNAESKAEPSNPFAEAPLVPPFQPSASKQPASQQQGAGEFTQLFQKGEARQSSGPMSDESSTRPLPPSSQFPAPTAGDHGPDKAPGEFTRVFVGGTPPNPNAAPKSADETFRTSPSGGGNQSRAKVFSSPGVSGSASGEGSFTQMFKSAPSTPSISQPSPPQAPPPPPAAKPSWNNDPIFRPQSSSPADPGSPSVTTLLASLGTSGNAAPSSRSQGNAPYRPDPVPYAPPPSSRDSSPDVSSGSVTSLIQRLAQTPAEPTPPPPPMTPAPASNSGPGEFTRMIARMGSSPAAEPPQAPPSAPATPVPVYAAPVPPPMPAFAPPAIPHAPVIPHAPAMAPPAAHVAPMPAIPKPPALAIQPIAPPKTKLEAMVPILLVINTFLLLVLLIVVIFLIKSR